jgi:hypothetical protein
MKHHGEHGEQDEEDDQRQGQRAEDRLLAEGVEPFREAADSAILEETAGDAA